MRAFFVSVATAAIGGLLMGAAIRPTESDLHEQPVGPQIVASSAWEGDVEAVSPVYHRVGPLPEYVIGTDWAHPKTYEPQIAAVYELPAEPEVYDEAEAYVMPASYAAASATAVEAEPRVEPRPVSYPSIDGDVVGPAPSASDNASNAVESFDDGGAQHVEVIRIDRQGGRHIDDLAHGSDPYALIGEPAA